MHILIIPSWYPGFSKDVNGSFFREQAIALHKNGCRVGVIHPQLRSLKNIQSLFKGAWGLEMEVDEGIPTYRWHDMNWFPRMPILKAKHMVHHGLRLFDRYMQDHGRPDIIHVHALLYAGSIAEAIKDRFGIPFVVTEHSSGYARNQVSTQEKKLAEKWACSANHCFAVSAKFAEFLSKYFSASAITWNEMPNIVSQYFLEFPKLNRDCNSGYTFIHVSLMEKNKDVDILIRAYKEVVDRYPEARLILGGDGPERKNLEALSKSLGLCSTITFKGRLSREMVASEMADADAFVLTSRYETFGVVVVESMALGKPVIATRCGGPESIVSDGTGLLVPVGDVNALSKAMLYLINNRNTYDAQKIRQVCESCYSEKAVTKRLKQIYKNILAVRA